MKMKSDAGGRVCFCGKTTQAASSMVENQTSRNYKIWKVRSELIITGFIKVFSSSFETSSLRVLGVSRTCAVESNRLSLSIFPHFVVCVAPRTPQLFLGECWWTCNLLSALGIIILAFPVILLHLGIFHIFNWSKSVKHLITSNIITF